MAEKQELETLRTVFDSFDKDKSGFIDISEIKAVSKELGHDVGDADVGKMFAEIDTNKDGKISFDEFAIWWHSGKSTKLEGLVYYWLKAHQLLEKAHVNMNKIGQTLEGKYDDTFENYFIGVQVGDCEPKSKIHIRGAFGGAEEKALFEETNGKLGRDWDEQAIAVTIGSSNPEKAAEELKTIYKTLLEFKKAMRLRGEERRIFDSISVDITAGADSVTVVVSSESPLLQMQILKMMQMLLDLLKRGTAGHASLQIGFKNDFASILKNHKDGVERNLIEEVIGAFSAELNTKLSPKLWAWMREETMKKNSYGYKPELIGMLLKGSKVSLKFYEIENGTLDAEFGDIISKASPLGKLPSIGDLIALSQQFSPGRMIQTLPLATQAYKLFREHMKADATITFRIKKTVITARLQTQGIKEVADAIMGDL